MSLGWMSAPSAQAGQWELTSITTDGKTTYSTNGLNVEDRDSNPGDGNIDWSAGVYNGTGYVGGGAGYAFTNDVGVSVSIHEAGGGTAIFEWNDSDGSLPADYLYYSVTADADMGGHNYIDSVVGPNSPGSLEVQASNGFETAEADEIFQILANGGQTRSSEAQALTTRLFRKASEGGSRIEIALRAIDGQVAITLPDGGNTNNVYGVSRTTASFVVKQDSQGRYVEIHSPTIEDSYYKGSGPSTTPGRIKHERDDNGSIVTDSAAQWNDSLGMWVALNQFDAVIDGNWSGPSYNWTIGGENTPTPGAANTNGHQSLTLSLNLGRDQGANADFPKDTNLEVAVTGGDGAVASNTFGVTWHLPAEWEASPYQTSAPFWNTIQPTNIIADNAGPSGSVSAEFQYENFYLGALGEAAPTVFKAGSYFLASGSLGIIQKLLLTTVGLAFEQAGQPNVETKNCSFASAWEMGTTPDTSLAGFADYPVFVDEADRPRLPDGSPDNRLQTKSRYQLTNIRHCVEYKNDSYRGDGFDQNGYSGEVTTVMQNLAGGAITVGDFVKGDTSDDDPAPSGG